VKSGIQYTKMTRFLTTQSLLLHQLNLQNLLLLYQPQEPCCLVLVTEMIDTQLLQMEKVAQLLK